MYKHVIERFQEEKIKPPYETFNASIVKINGLYSILQGICYVNNIDLEACGEEGFHTPCISQKDLDILQIKDIKLIGSAEQRKTCSCPSYKTELIKGKPHRCPNKCLYCFWKDN